MKGELINKIELISVMVRNNLTIEDVAELTSSATRSVYRWRERGIPKNKLELLQLKTAKANPAAM